VVPVKEKTVLVALSFGVLLFAILSLAAQLLFLTQFPQPALPSEAAARASTAQARFCINHVPDFNNTCNATMVQNSSYYCHLNASDADGDNVSFSTEFINPPNATFNITANGVINFTPTNDDVGNHTVRLNATDSSGCDGNQNSVLWNFNIENINDPPYLVMPIPDQEFQVNTTLSAFFLSTYFRDPDNDPLTYNVSGHHKIMIEILPSSEVRFFADACAGSEHIIFQATDPYNASAASNRVKITVDCSHQGGSNDTGEGDKGGGGSSGATMACQPAWECDDWWPCLPTGFQWRRCYDRNGCEAEKYFKRECVYQGAPPACIEDWLCDDWGQCYINGTQYRSCRDLTDCGTNTTKPPLEQKCVYQPTCNDGVQNGDETGVDCGGSICPVCPIVQQPSLIGGQNRANAWLVLIILLSIILISGILHYYRSRIAQVVAVIGFMLKHRSYKDILLDAPQRKSFFERILAFEQLLHTEAGQKMTAGAVYSTLANLVRQYVAVALALPEEALPEEVAARCKELKLRPETAAMLQGLFAKLSIIEQEELELDMLFVSAALEELRTAVCLTSDYKHDELLRPVEEVVIDDKMSFYDEIFARSMNVMRAVQYDQLEDARKMYLELLTRYDPLSDAEKEQIYPELRWVFNTVKFASEMTGARVVQKPAMAA